MEHLSQARFVVICNYLTYEFHPNFDIDLMFTQSQLICHTVVLLITSWSITGR